MDSKQYRQIKKASELVKYSLENDNLSAEERHKLEQSYAQMCGYLASPWLPVGIWRKIVMVILLIFGAYGFAVDKPIIAVCWVLIPAFSPRIVGETFFFIGQLTRKT
jgi:hypothetical protein